MVLSRMAAVAGGRAVSVPRRRRRRAPRFAVKDCALVTIALGKSAQNLRELRDRVAEVPVQSLYHHFWESLLRPTFDDPEYRNDFALWARRHLHDARLAERLGIVDPMDYHDDLEQLRRHLLDVIEDRMSESTHVPWAAPGHEFHFLRSQVVVLDGGLEAGTPEDLAALVPTLSTGSIFFHFVEARRRPPVLVDDFSAWLEPWGPAYEGVRARLADIDTYLWSLVELRGLIARSFVEASPGERP